MHGKMNRAIEAQHQRYFYKLLNVEEEIACKVLSRALPFKTTNTILHRQSWKGNQRLYCVSACFGDAR